MKKVLSIVAVAALSAAFVSCGPSKEELAAKQKVTDDSIARIVFVADSTAQADTLAAQTLRAEQAALAAPTETAAATTETASAKDGKKEVK